MQFPKPTIQSQGCCTAVLLIRSNISENPIGLAVYASPNAHPAVLSSLKYIPARGLIIVLPNIIASLIFILFSFVLFSFFTFIADGIRSSHTAIESLLATLNASVDRFTLFPLHHPTIGA